MKRSSYINMLFIVSMLVGIFAVATCAYATPVVTTNVTATVSSFIGEHPAYFGTVTDNQIEVNNFLIPGSNTNKSILGWNPTTNLLDYNGAAGSASGGASLTATTATVQETSTANSGSISAYSRIGVSAPPYGYINTSRTITFNIPYSFDITLKRDNVSEYCAANAHLLLELHNYDLNQGSRVELPVGSGYWLLDAKSNDLSQHFADSGTATVTLDFDMGLNKSGQTYQGVNFLLMLDTTAYTWVPQNAVPIPGTAMLLGSALLSLGAWRRFRKS